LILERVKLTNFRNLEQFEVDVSPRINIFLGRNGQGKTNLLEALAYLSLGRSPRGSRDQELIQFDEDFCRVEVTVRDRHGDVTRLEAAVPREGKKRICIDGQPVDRLSDLVGHWSVVRFDPDEVELAKGSPEHRRRFLDHSLSLSSAEYFRRLLDYRRALAQKNRLLKVWPRPSSAEIEVWNHELVEWGTPLLVERQAVLGRLQELAARIYSEMAPEGGSIELRLRSTVLPPEFEVTDGELDESIERGRDLFRIALEDARTEEARFGHSRVGPHRDRLEILLRDRSLRRYGSQGEMRTASIALKLAQGELLLERTQTRPAIVLDDIFSELDRGRTDALQAWLHQEHQLFIATARVDDVVGMRDWPDLRVWQVEGGRLSELEDISDARLDALRVEFEEDKASEAEEGRS
jgi:DNA replication and repair protein RecF